MYIYIYIYINFSVPKHLKRGYGENTNTVPGPLKNLSFNTGTFRKGKNVELIYTTFIHFGLSTLVLYYEELDPKTF